MPSNLVPDTGLTCESPVFVLTSSRSGSTLLRFILDSHPELACPPETTVASACASLLRSWASLEGAGSEGRSSAGASRVPAAGIAVVQSAMDQLFGTYLRRRGKRRWCDKSLDSYVYADLIAQAYPKAKFICLYRHCMDVIASGVEACPWGVSRFGFDQFVAQYPGNNVAAIGAYWMSCAQTIGKFEEENPSSCHRVRYEDLVTAPEETVAAMFDFLDLPQVPGITNDCFKIPHESNGPGDEKIWFTDQVKSSGIGRGVRVPVGALPEPMLADINQALDKLGYKQMGPGWNDVTGPFDPRVGMIATSPGQNGKASPPSSQPETASALRALDERLGMRIGTDLEAFAVRWPELQTDTFALVVDGDEPTERRWSLGDLSDPIATLVAPPGTWRSLLDGETNVVGELTAGRLRCINKRDRYRLRSEELHAMTWLLGLTHIPVEPATALAVGEAD
jgi:protein-tyrosine sulfotransferase